MTNHVLFVGAGNMGSAIIKSYLKISGTSDVIHVIDPFVSDNTKDLLSECKFYESFTDLQDSIEFDTVVLAIKPQYSSNLVGYFHRKDAPPLFF